MSQQKILREAQNLASKYSFWMVSGDISHLYGYILEDKGKKYDLEIIFPENFPKKPPELVYHENIHSILGQFKLKTLDNWHEGKSVLNVLEELHSLLKSRINQVDPRDLGTDFKISGEIENIKEKDLGNIDKSLKKKANDEYLTPDLDAYPPEFDNEVFLPDSGPEKINQEDLHEEEFFIQEEQDIFYSEQEHLNKNEVLINTELGLLQQEYALDEIGQEKGIVKVYLTITLTKTFLIEIDFTNYPERPLLTFPVELRNFLKMSPDDLDILKSWNKNNPAHIVEILRELETRLFSLSKIELETKKIQGEFKCEVNPSNPAMIKVYLLTYGLSEYVMDVDLSKIPNDPPAITLSPELSRIIRIPVNELSSYKNWVPEISEVVEIIREIAWLVDKNARIEFEVDLLRDHYKDLKYDPITQTIKVDVKGRMKTQDIVFNFEITLPRDYPISKPNIRVLN
ncbi:MAG: ubiquitin-conjugating enzyme E2 variant, partial [Candidatus Helarchaeota archaeon]